MFEYDIHRYYTLLTYFFLFSSIYISKPLSITLVPFLSFTISLSFFLSHTPSLSLSRMKLQRQKDGYKPGDYGFDPLGLYSFRSSFGIDRIDEKLTREEKISRAKFDMELCEVRT